MVALEAGVDALGIASAAVAECVMVGGRKEPVAIPPEDPCMSVQGESVEDTAADLPETEFPATMNLLFLDLSAPIFVP